MSTIREALAQIYDAGHYQHYVEPLQKYVNFEDANILDVGSGLCWHAPFFRALGARSVLCVDKHVDLNSHDLRIHNEPNKANHNINTTLSISKFLCCFEGIEITKSEIEEYDPRVTATNLCIMQTVTEHLLQPDKAIAAIAKILPPGATIYLSHGNYYAWGGHHLPPYTVTEYDPNDPSHAQLADWHHVVNVDLVDNKYIELNKIRIHELAALLRPYFDAKFIDFVTSPDEVSARLTSNIALNLFTYSREELLTDLWIFVGERKAEMATTAPQVKFSVLPITISKNNYREGYCYIVGVPFSITAENYELYYNGELLPLGDCNHDDIRSRGDGRYSIWGPTLYFSLPGNVDPFRTEAAIELRRR